MTASRSSRDGVETALAYAWILENADGPAMLSLTRQDLDAVTRCEPFELYQRSLGQELRVERPQQPVGGGDHP